MLFRKPRQSRKSIGDSGATAIEYAIIAALIGIGLIASLVSTKGSLSAVFGVASSNMGSANAQSGGSGGGSVAAPSYWAAKTLSSNSKAANGYGGFNYTYVYTDGTRVTFNTQPNDGTQNFLMTTQDPAANQVRYAFANKQNELNLVQVRQFSGSFSQVESDSYVYNNNQTPVGTNPLSGQTMVTALYTNGDETSSNSTPTAELKAYAATAQSDLTYFKSISN